MRIFEQYRARISHVTTAPRENVSFGYHATQSDAAFLATVGFHCKSVSAIWVPRGVAVRDICSKSCETKLCWRDSWGQMPVEPEIDAAYARSASPEQLKSLVHDARSEILEAVLENTNLEEAHVNALLGRLDLPANVISTIAGEPKWLACASVRVALARHPRTPKRIALSVLRQLFLFDLARLSLLPSAPADIRRAAEELILTRVPNLPVGEKLTLARRGPARVAGALLAEGHPQAIKLALDNAFLTESQVLKVLAKPGVPERAVAAVAQHGRWSRMPHVRVALLRNPLTPAPHVIAFLPDITLRDLKDLAGLETLPPHVRRYIERELRRRREKTGEGAFL